MYYIRELSKRDKVINSSQCLGFVTSWPIFKKNSLDSIRSLKRWYIDDIICCLMLPKSPSPKSVPQTEFFFKRDTDKKFSLFFYHILNWLIKGTVARDFLVSFFHESTPNRPLMNVKK
jgi:hypothetical protein